MEIKDYLQFARKTAVYPQLGNNWIYPLLGLSGEVGELVNQLKKAIRDDNYHISADRYIICRDELGDIFWYLAMLCWELNIDPDDVLQRNIAKLELRMQKNTIHDRGNRDES